MEKQNYELAFHLNPNLEESKVQETKQALEKSITGRNGNVLFSREPEKMRLSYQIKHNDNAFFGYIQFTVENANDNQSPLCWTTKRGRAKTG
ncbi:MAG: 30S ribosomal protein S6 [Candidatus Yanofskybacteria bacterium]|nr:30S ribosomal protein S6 [Candidatus Yanofskybacteria bacterium]